MQPKSWERFEKNMDPPASSVVQVLLFLIRDALASGVSIDTLYNVTKIDPWFLRNMADIVEEESRVRAAKTNGGAVDRHVLRRAKQYGYSDRQLAHMWGMDEMEVQVEVSERTFSDEMSKLEALGERIRAEIENTLGLRVSVRLVEPRSLERSMGKAKRVIDRRDLGR